MKSETSKVDEPRKPGIRAQAKQASQDKIVMAARKLFAEHGYDATKLRQIADAAGLGLATLFNHISDKRDLIYLIFNADVEAVTYRAIAAPRSWQSFEEKILTLSEPFFRLFAAEHILAEVLLSEVLQQTPGPHLLQHLHLRDVLIRELCRIAAEAQAAGELSSTPSSETIGLCLFFAFQGSSRWWLASENSDWLSGQRHFRNILSIMVNGMRTTPKKPRVSKSRRRPSLRLAAR